MSLARLLAMTLLAGSLPAIAQVHMENTTPTAPIAATKAHMPMQEQSNQLSSRLPDVTSTQEPSEELRANTGQSDSGSQFAPLVPNSDKGIVLSPDGALAADTTCFAIRSYVVARDAKDSDSTHLVGYSTCQPAKRYRFRTAQATSSER